MEVKIEDYGTVESKNDVKKFTLSSGPLTLELTNYGATLLALHCPDRHSNIDDIVLGFDNFQDLSEKNTAYFGNTIGRCANRIKNGTFRLDEQDFLLATNCENNHLHGGLKGFDKRVWSWRIDEEGVHFNYTSPDGEEGYPGNLHVEVTYKLTNHNEVKITNHNEVKILFKANTTDRRTVVNLTNHAYFNLAGQKSGGTILDHVLQLNADHYLPHVGGIPTGEIADVDQVFDFTSPKPIGTHIQKASTEGGYDHNFCLKKGSNFCAKLQHEGSGRQVEIFTSQPGLQIYTGNFLDHKGKQGNVYNKYSGIALEPQNYPDAINQPTFPSCILSPGESYEHFITWKLSTF